MNVEPDLMKFFSSTLSRAGSSSSPTSSINRGRPKDSASSMCVRKYLWFNDVIWSREKNIVQHELITSMVYLVLNIHIIFEDNESKIKFLPKTFLLIKWHMLLSWSKAISLENRQLKITLSIYFKTYMFLVLSACRLLNYHLVRPSTFDVTLMPSFLSTLIRVSFATAVL